MMTTSPFSSMFVRIDSILILDGMSPIVKIEVLHQLGKVLLLVVPGIMFGGNYFVPLFVLKLAMVRDAPFGIIIGRLMWVWLRNFLRSIVYVIGSILVY